MERESRTMRVLLVEDNPGDAELIRDMLREYGSGLFTLGVVDRLEPAFGILERGDTDAVLLDLSLPGTRGLESLSTFRSRVSAVPVIVLTGLDDDEAAVEAVSLGAQDFLIKGKFDGGQLVRAIRYGIERHISKSALMESEERFRALVDDSPVGIFIVQDGMITYRNPEFGRLFGPIPETFRLADFSGCHPDDAERFKELCGAISGVVIAVHDTELRFHPFGAGPQGDVLRWVFCRTTPIRYRGRKASIVSMVDMTRIREMERIAELREKMSVLGHIAACMAHEIRNPLSGINIYLSVLDTYLSDPGVLTQVEAEEARKTVAQIRSATNQIESVVRKTLSISRPTPPKMQPVDLNDAIMEAIDFYSIALRQRGITIEPPRLESLPKCAADPKKIVQVLVSLLLNVGEMFDRFSGVKSVLLSSCVEDGSIVIRVADSGPGIPSEYREKIFEPLQTQWKKGYGLGLAFCRNAIAEHGGNLTVGRREGGGGEFRIEIPVVRGKEGG